MVTLKERSTHSILNYISLYALQALQARIIAFIYGDYSRKLFCEVCYGYLAFSDVIYGERRG